MRELKFRAWDKIQKIMWYEFFISSRSGYLVGGRDNQFISVNQEDYFLMQFTGLLDKNEKEIFEGDICSWDSGRVIDYVELKDNQGWKMRDLYNIDWWKDAEVIGNVHEHSELLK